MQSSSVLSDPVHTQTQTHTQAEKDMIFSKLERRSNTSQTKLFLANNLCKHEAATPSGDRGDSGGGRQGETESKQRQNTIICSKITRLKCEQIVKDCV